MSAVIEAAPSRNVSLVAKMASRYDVEPDKLLVTLKATAFKTDKPISNETMMALLIVADQYKLNPFTKELYAFPDKRGGIVPVVSIDGWIRIVNEHSQYDGCELDWLDEEQAYRCTMHRKDRGHPTVVTEYMVECNRGTEPWKSHPRRMLRHKAYIQGARMAFGFGGIYDEDEAERIAESRVLAAQQPAPNVERVREVLRGSAEDRVFPASDDGVIDMPKTIDAADLAASPPSATDPSANLVELLQNLREAPDEESAAAVLEEGRQWVTAEQHTILQTAYHGLYGTARNEP
jgi:phage recombination protein Bet